MKDSNETPKERGYRNRVFRFYSLKPMKNNCVSEPAVTDERAAVANKKKKMFA